MPTIQVELYYSSNCNLLDGGHYSGKVIKEDGTVLLELDEAYGMELNEYPALSNKLIGYVQGSGFLNPNRYTYIFGLQEFFNVTQFNKQSVVISPNPAATFVDFKSNNIPITKVVVYDSQGRKVGALSSTSIVRLDVSGFTDGLYFLTLTDADNNNPVQKLIVRH